MAAEAPNEPPLVRDADAVQRDQARALWQSFETIHALTYFDPRCLDAMTDAGAKGFWMGYFIGRMAPLGEVGPATAEAVCFGFAPQRPYRALPDGWTFVRAADALAVRGASAAAALRAGGVSDAMAEPLLEPLAALARGTSAGGRPLGAANQALPLPADPVAALWQLTTTLREQRGDTHVALWVAAGIDGCEANVLTTTVHRQSPDIIRTPRAFAESEWLAATSRLAARGLVAARTDGADPCGSTATEAGRALHEHVEHETDRRAASDYAAATGAGDLVALGRALHMVAVGLGDAGIIPYPNPMGLPPLAKP